MRDVPKARKTVKDRVNRLIDDLMNSYFKDYRPNSCEWFVSRDGWARAIKKGGKLGRVWVVYISSMITCQYIVIRGGPASWVI